MNIWIIGLSILAVISSNVICRMLNPGGVYDIITVETYDPDELDKKMEQLSDLCDNCGAVDVSMADDRIWEARKMFADACRELCLTWASSDYVVPLDQIIHVTSKLPEIMEKHHIDGGIVAILETVIFMLIF